MSYRKQQFVHQSILEIKNTQEEFYSADLISSASSRITDVAPSVGKHIIETLIQVAVNRLTVETSFIISKKIVSKIKNPKKILVVSDENIGDAVNLQSVIAALKIIFPSVLIDYAVNKQAVPLVKYNPDIYRTWDIFSSKRTNNIFLLKKVLYSNKYDFVINLSPFIPKTVFSNSLLINYTSLVYMLIYNELNTLNPNHVSFQAYKWIMNLFGKKHNYRYFDGTRIYLSSEVINSAKEFLRKNGVSGNKVFFHPDATSKYTLIPFNIQLDILNELCRSAYVNKILLGSGHTFSNIEKRLAHGIGGCDKIIIIPFEFSIDMYAALIDMCDVFITPDTGTMHIAAAKKFDETGQKLNNNTAIFSIFGATSARMYGYDSYRNGFLKPNQNAPAKLYISKAKCRNITCNNKKAKKCRYVECFSGICGTQISKDVECYLADK